MPFSDELLSAYLDGEVTPEERALVEERLAADPALKALLDELRGAADATRTLPKAKVDADFRHDVMKAIDREAAKSVAEKWRTTHREPLWKRPGVKRGIAWSALAATACFVLARLAPDDPRLDHRRVAQGNAGERSAESLKKEATRPNARDFASDQKADHDATGQRDRAAIELRAAAPPAAVPAPEAVRELSGADDSGASPSTESLADETGSRVGESYALGGGGGTAAPMTVEGRLPSSSAAPSAQASPTAADKPAEVGGIAGAAPGTPATSESVPGASSGAADRLDAAQVADQQVVNLVADDLKAAERRLLKCLAEEKFELRGDAEEVDAPVVFDNADGRQLQLMNQANRAFRRYAGAGGGAGGAGPVAYVVTASPFQCQRLVARLQSAERVEDKAAAAPESGAAVAGLKIDASQQPAAAALEREATSNMAVAAEKQKSASQAWAARIVNRSEVLDRGRTVDAGKVIASVERPRDDDLHFAAAPGQVQVTIVLEEAPSRAAVPKRRE